MRYLANNDGMPQKASPHGQPSSAYNTRLEADVLIKNNGPNILHSCRITRSHWLSVMMNPTVYAQKFHNQNLAPGDFMWLSPGAIHRSVAFTRVTTSDGLLIRKVVRGN